jgi:hypothetical protein
MRKTLNETLCVEEVDNGYILRVGADLHRGGLAHIYVFNCMEDLQNFISNYLETK